jgi:hypothetical protein
LRAQLQMKPKWFRELAAPFVGKRNSRVKDKVAGRRSDALPGLSSW